jgi:hypothetical protein
MGYASLAPRRRSASSRFWHSLERFGMPSYRRAEDTGQHKFGSFGRRFMNLKVIAPKRLNGDYPKATPVTSALPARSLNYHWFTCTTGVNDAVPIDDAAPDRAHRARPLEPRPCRPATHRPRRSRRKLLPTISWRPQRSGRSGRI